MIQIQLSNLHVNSLGSCGETGMSVSDAECRAKISVGVLDDVQVNPSKEQYEANIYEGIRLQLTTFVGECHEEMMVNTRKRNREMGEGKLKFEAGRRAIELMCLLMIRY